MYSCFCALVCIFNNPISWHIRQTFFENQFAQPQIGSGTIKNQQTLLQLKSSQYDFSCGYTYAFQAQIVLTESLMILSFTTLPPVLQRHKLQGGDKWELRPRNSESHFGVGVIKWNTQFKVAIERCHLANWALLSEVAQDQEIIFGNKHKSDLPVTNYH